MRDLTETDWERELRAELGSPVRVAYGRSRSSPLQVRPPTERELARVPELEGGWVVRMHPLFAGTPPDVRRAVASWIRSGRRARRACRIMGEWMNAALAELPAETPAPGTLEVEGGHHHLGELAAPLLRECFRRDFGPDRPVPGLTWGRRARSKSRGSLRLGSFEPSQDLVRVHPVLDQPAVPAWFVRYVLFHELLHAAVPPELGPSGRALHHGPSFRRREAGYPDYARAVEWERKHIDALIRSARSGRPMRRPAAPPERPAPRRRGAIWRQLDLFRALSASTRR